MSDDHLTDEVLSAVLDGEATAAEARHAADCAACGARLRELQRAASLIGSPVPLGDASVREAAIARALEARAVPLRSRRRMPLGWLVGAAAAVVALALAVPLLHDDSSADRDSTAAAPEAAGGAAGATTSALAAPVAFGDLGAVDDASLADRVRSALAPPSAAASGQAADSSERVAADETATCVEQLSKGDESFGVLRGTGSATVAGQEATVLVFGSADGRIRVFAVRPSACDDVLLSVTFPSQ